MATLYSLGDKGKIPGRGKPGDVHFVAGQVYLVLADGTLANSQKLHDTFAQLGIKAIEGPKGEPGKDGAPGADSMVPGPKGDKGDRGERGEKGEPGDVLNVGPAEIEAAAKRLREQKAHIIATIAQCIEDSEHLAPPIKSLLRAHFNRIRQAAR